MEILRKGDIVTITAVVSADFYADRLEDDYFRNKVAVLPHDHHSNVWVDIAHVELKMPLFTKNDFVVAEGKNGQVIATSDDWAWVRLDDGELVTCQAASLSRRRPEHGVAACALNAPQNPVV